MNEVYLQYHRLVESFRSRESLDSVRSDPVSSDARIRAAFMRVLEEEIGELRDDQSVTTDTFTRDTLAPKKTKLS